jgi:hypothetical protein
MADRKARVTVEVERLLLRQVKAKAALEGRTISDVVRVALRGFVDGKAGRNEDELEVPATAAWPDWE